MLFILPRSLPALPPLLPVLIAVLFPSSHAQHAAPLACPHGYDTIALQLQWLLQAQFAGYIVGIDKGFYKDQCINLVVRPGGTSVTQEQELLEGRAQFAIRWLPPMLAAREQGKNITLIAQVFRRSAMLQISWKDIEGGPIRSPLDWKDKKNSNWGASESFSLRATLAKVSRALKCLRLFAFISFV
jgi:NitT/TauT family transport system substrate-binding protein